MNKPSHHQLKKHKKTLSLFLQIMKERNPADRNSCGIGNSAVHHNKHRISKEGEKANGVTKPAPAKR
jgi:hypothetical protein